MAKTYIKKVTPEFRVSYPSVFQPSAMKNSAGQVQGEAKYGLVMLIPKSTDITELRALVTAAVVEKWPDPAKRPKPLRNPIRDGDKEKPESEGYAGHWFIAARNKTKPGIVDENCVAILDADKFYAGCFARATVTAFGYDQAGNRGVSLSLQNVQKLRDGTPFSGRSKAEDDFGPVPTAGKAPEVVAGSNADMFN